MGMHERTRTGKTRSHQQDHPYQLPAPLLPPFLPTPFASPSIIIVVQVRQNKKKEMGREERETRK